MDLENYPTVNRVYKNLQELQAFKTAHAFAQPDCPEELRVAGKLQWLINALDYSILLDFLSYT